MEFPLVYKFNCRFGIGTRRIASLNFGIRSHKRLSTITIRTTRVLHSIVYLLKKLTLFSKLLTSHC